MLLSQRNRLFDLLAQPTAPFREQHVIAWSERVLARAGVPFCADPAGNLIVGAGSLQAYQKLLRARSSEPVRVFIAHMDHPGFHGVRWLSPRRLAVRWHGGAPIKHVNGAKVWLADGQGICSDGKLTKVALSASGMTINTAEVLVDGSSGLAAGRRARTLFGGFGFRAPAWRSGRHVYTKAADDLVGVFAIIDCACRIWRRGSRATIPPFIGLLTRAEEVGFVGAIAHFEQGWLTQARRQVLCVSLESSRTLPGARIGKGPIVRLGDRRTVFAADATQVLSELAQRVLPGAHQRRIMDGGACEASAATAYDLPAIGLSVPLGNYHNQGFEGGPDCRHAQGPAPEFVHLDDIDGMLKLCRVLLKKNLPWTHAWDGTRRNMQKRLRSYRRLLEQ